MESILSGRTGRLSNIWCDWSSSTINTPDWDRNLPLSSNFPSGPLKLSRSWLTSLKKGKHHHYLSLEMLDIVSFSWQTTFFLHWNSQSSHCALVFTIDRLLASALKIKNSLLSLRIPYSNVLSSCYVLAVLPVERFIHPCVPAWFRANAQGYFFTYEKATAGRRRCVILLLLTFHQLVFQTVAAHHHGKL